MAANSSVRALLNYSVDNGTALDYYFYNPEPGVRLNPPGTDIKEVEIHNGWPEVNQIKLDKEGFELHEFDSSFRDLLFFWCIVITPKRVVLSVSKILFLMRRMNY